MIPILPLFLFFFDLKKNFFLVIIECLIFMKIAGVGQTIGRIKSQISIKKNSIHYINLTELFFWIIIWLHILSCFWYLVNTFEIEYGAT